MLAYLTLSSLHFNLGNGKLWPYLVITHKNRKQWIESKYCLQVIRYVLHSFVRFCSLDWNSSLKSNSFIWFVNRSHRQWDTKIIASQRLESSFRRLSLTADSFVVASRVSPLNSLFLFVYQVFIKICFNSLK